MPLVINLRHLEAHSLKLKGELPVKDLDLDLRDDLIRAEKPLQYDLEAEQMDDGVLLQGRLQLPLQCLCVRCLKPFEFQLTLGKWAQLLPLAGEEKVSVINDCVDLTPFVREDILLEFPQHPLCEMNCRGLPKTSVGKAKKSSGGGQNEGRSSAWAALDKLKLKN
jgi:uncharacterized metal-binding protein YceD (DUF177 family)